MFIDWRALAWWRLDTSQRFRRIDVGRHNLCSQAGGFMASNSFQNEVPKARVNIKLDLHTGGAQKKVELPLKLMVMGDYSNGKEQRALSERDKVDINKNNFDNVLAEFSPDLKLAVENTLAGDASDTSVELSFQSMRDFEPEQVARQIPQLRALLAMRNLLRDLKSNLLDNATFRNELERILKDEALSNELRAELAALAPHENR
jgi:type VI secretion system protein ImpB